MTTILLLLSLLMYGLESVAQPPVHRETITRTLEFPDADTDNLLVLKNISGHVKVTGYEGDEVKIVVEKTIKADNQQDLQQGIEEIELTTQMEGNTMLVYTDAPFVLFAWKKDHANYHVNHDDEEYSFHMDYTVQVPRRLNLDVSTINDGSVAIEKVTGNHIEAHNVNGDIHCTEISGQTVATTVNGDMEITYSQAPAQDSRYQTVNGNITLVTQEKLSADVSFKSMNGDFYTNFDELQPLPASVKSDQQSGNKKTTYRIDQVSKFRIGKGGPLYTLETLNGAVYLKHL